MLESDLDCGRKENGAVRCLVIEREVEAMAMRRLVVAEDRGTRNMLERGRERGRRVGEG